MANEPVPGDGDNRLLFKICKSLANGGGGGGGVTTFNTRSGAVTLSSADVTGALGFTPADASLYVLKAGDSMSGDLSIGSLFTTYLATGILNIEGDLTLSSTAPFIRHNTTNRSLRIGQDPAAGGGYIRFYGGTAGGGNAGKLQIFGGSGDFEISFASGSIEVDPSGNWTQTAPGAFSLTPGGGFGLYCAGALTAPDLFLISAANLTAGATTLNVTTEWEDATSNFTAFQLSVTATSVLSLSACRLLSLNIGGSEKFFVDGNGNVGAAGSASGFTSISADTHVSTANTVNAQVGTSYTLLASDNGKVVTLNNAAAITLTVPASLGAGFSCTLVQLGAGQVTVTPSGTTVNSYGSLTKLAGQHASATLFAYSANVFNLAGALTA